jgi:hypothetical protein
VITTVVNEGATSSSITEESPYPLVLARRTPYRRQMEMFTLETRRVTFQETNRRPHRPPRLQAHRCDDELPRGHPGDGKAWETANELEDTTEPSFSPAADRTTPTIVALATTPPVPDGTSKEGTTPRSRRRPIQRILGFHPEWG